MTRWLTTILKFAVSAAILGCLFYKLFQDSDDTLAGLISRPIRWELLACALVAVSLAVVITFVRWYLLAHALGLTFSLRDAIRLGFLGYMFNFLSLGIVGGDLIKSVFMAREQPGRRIEAVATVAVDRLVGLYGLILVASVAVLSIDFANMNVRQPGDLARLEYIGHAIVGLALVGAAAVAIVLLPGFTTGSVWGFFSRLPWVGQVIHRLVDAIRVYKSRLGILLLCLMISVAVHGLNCIGIYLLARGLPGEIPSFGVHCVVTPIALAAGAVPLPGGLGAFEATMDVVYRIVSPVGVAASQGFVIALGYRIITVLIASIGVVYWIMGRREVARIMDEASIQTEGSPARSRKKLQFS